MYFVLKLLPEGETVHVDVQEGSREYHILKTMHSWKHIFISESEGFIDRIASTKLGVNFYAYLVRNGFGTLEPDAEGKEIIERLTKAFQDE